MCELVFVFVKSFMAFALTWRICLYRNICRPLILFTLYCIETLSRCRAFSLWLSECLVGEGQQFFSQHHYFEPPKILYSQITDEISAVEAATRRQSNSKVWFLQRAGRITASNFKSAARTNPAMPAPSLIKKIYYPDAFKFHTPATRYSNSAVLSFQESI